MEKIDMLATVRRICHITFSVYASLVLLGIYVLVLIASVFIEKEYGMQAAKEWVYHHPLWMMLHICLVLSFLVRCVQQKLWRCGKYAVCMLHIAFIFILLGAYLTHLLAFEGSVHLCEGEKTSWIHDSQRAYQLPFTIYLNDFNLVRYRGSKSPFSYECHITLLSHNNEQREVMYMSGMIHKDGYRIYQTSYDADERGVWLLIRYDKWGVWVTYAGYVLLLLAMMGILLERNSHFRQLIRKIAVLVIGGFFVCNVQSLSATNACGNRQLSKQTIPLRQADQWKSVQIISSSGRVEPFNTLALQMLRQLYQHETYQGFSAEQVMVGFLVNPSVWNTVPLIYQSNQEITQALNLSTSKYLSFSELFDEEGHYLLEELVEKAYQKAEFERTNFERDLLKLDQKVYLLYALQHGNLFSMHSKVFLPSYLSAVERGLHYDDWEYADRMLKTLLQEQYANSDLILLDNNQVQLELWYNKFYLFSKFFWGYIILGLLLLGISIYGLLKKLGGVMRFMLQFCKLGIVLFFLLHTLAIFIRWYISGHAPLVHSYETMVYLAWSMAFAGICFIRRSSITMSLTSCMAGILLIVCQSQLMNVAITPLLPVLQSCWLGIHVAVIMAGYGFFSMSCLLGIFSLLWMTTLKVKTQSSVISHLRIINEISLHIGLYLLIVGIFVGAVWANESWGSYWNWDPKETWALITMMVYTLILHLRLVPRLCSDYTLHLFSVVAFSSVCMTYLGVNVFWNGLHTYSDLDASVSFELLFSILLALFLFIFYVSVIRLVRCNHSGIQ